MKKETIVNQTEFTRPKCQHETRMKFERINELPEKCMRFRTEDLRLKDVTNQWLLIASQNQEDPEPNETFSFVHKCRLVMSGA